MKRRVKLTLSKLNFWLQQNPKVVSYKNVDYRKYIPEPYKAVLIISADFELAWAWRFAKGTQRPKDEAIRHARVARRNIPKILKLCDAYNVPITWATVGHLLVERCDTNGGIPHSHLKRIPYHENRYWKFDTGGWYDDDPCTDWTISPEWYAPDLIKMIIDSKVGHEIACHTFSHVDCRDAVCTPGILDDEVRECQKYGRAIGVEMASFVHPGHTIGNIATLKQLGFTSFRTDYHNVLGLPIRHDTGLWELQTSAEIHYRNGWSVDYHIYRFRTIIDRGVRHRRLIYFWFHPSFPEVVVDRILDPILAHIAQLRDAGKLLVVNTKDYVHYLNDPH